jgi:hypothetical protein
MSGDQRFKAKLRNMFRRVCLCQKAVEPTGNDDVEDGSTGPSPQYRLEATRKGQRRGIIANLLSCFRGTSGSSGAVGIGINANQRLAVYLHWMFRVNFIFLFAVMCTMFFALVMVFAGVIVGVGRLDAECIQVGGVPFANASAPFADAFALSWTTFSTVGYGSTYPALGQENSNRTNCLFITIVCSLESFVGVLYSGFCGAILFGKVLRIQSHAQVLFSDPIVIRYGCGLAQTGPGSDTEDEEDEDEDDLSANHKKKIPCPVLEFRVVNRLFQEVGGEIMDATLNVVANVDANDADPALRGGLLDSDSSRAREDGRSSGTTIDSMSDTPSDAGSSNRESHRASTIRGNRFILENILTRHDHHAVDEDPSARLVNKRIFSKMLIEASDHPFFKRVWLARHVLDDSSPILKPRVRRQIRRNNGHWPEKLNNHASIRDSLQFNQILVSLNGVSNVSASYVYAQKIYDFVDINVGYQFVNILYRDIDDSLRVDTDLINDVREQTGGVGEPLILGE